MDASARWTQNLIIEANLSPCAHLCRYCSIGDRSAPFPMDRWMAFVERFIDWSKGRNAPKVISGFMPSYNFDIDAFVRLSRWSERVFGEPIKALPLGGLKKRPEGEVRLWLLDRQAAGVERVSASFVGIGKVHDQWNGRRGDYDFLMSTLRIAGEIGMALDAQLFLVKSSLPFIELLAEAVRAVSAPSSDIDFRPFFIVGYGAHHEAERIDENDREKLPRWVGEALIPQWILRSEREWLKIIDESPETERPRSLKLVLDAETIDQLEALPCDEILCDLERRAAGSFDYFPTLTSLARSYGDPLGTGIFISRTEVDRFWLQKWLKDHPMAFDRSLLHYHLGRSPTAPPLWMTK